MIDTTQLFTDLCNDEGGLRQLVYDDATGHAIGTHTIMQGHPTIGVGRALDAKGLSLREVCYLLDNDIAEYWSDLSPLPWFANLDPVRQQAVMNMRHQLGLAGVLAFHDMIACLQHHDYPGAAAAGLASAWAGETPDRAALVMRQLRTGTFRFGSAPPPTPSTPAHAETANG